MRQLSINQDLVRPTLVLVVCPRTHPWNFNHLDSRVESHSPQGSTAVCFGGKGCGGSAEIHATKSTLRLSSEISGKGFERE